MPFRSLFDELAAKAGIPEEVSRYVSRLIDQPKRVSELVEFLKSRESGSGKVVECYLALRPRPRGTINGARDHLESLLRTRDPLHVRAWLLRSTLDYLARAPPLPPGEVLKRFEERVVRAASTLGEEWEAVTLREWRTVRGLAERAADALKRPRGYDAPARRS